MGTLLKTLAIVALFGFGLLPLGVQIGVAPAFALEGDGHDTGGDGGKGGGNDEDSVKGGKKDNSGINVEKGFTSREQGSNAAKNDCSCTKGGSYSKGKTGGDMGYNEDKRR